MAEPHVVVLGGGPAGDVAALRAAQLGADVTLIEEAELGGTCLNWGCIPTKSLLAGTSLLRKVRRASELGIAIEGSINVDFPRMMERKQEIVLRMRSGVESACKRHKVNVVHGHGVIIGDTVKVGGDRYPFDHLILCVGTAASGVPSIDMSKPNVVTSDGILQLEKVPKSMLVIGGGVIGCEFASLFSTLGTNITVVEVLPSILSGVEPRVASQFQRLMEADGVTFHPGHSAVDFGYRKNQVEAELDDGKKVKAELMLVSVGRKPLTSGIGVEEAGVVIDELGYIEVDSYLRSANPKIWGAGDCIGGLQLAHLASAEAARAVENALGHNVREMDRTVVPSCIYTHPEIAMVGLNSESGKSCGYDVKVSQARYIGNGRALAEDEIEGMTQICSDKSTGLILGATIMGAHAVEIIHEIAVAMSDGLTIDELGDIIHAHPTVSELVMDAAQLGTGTAPYLS